MNSQTLQASSDELRRKGFLPVDPTDLAAIYEIYRNGAAAIVIKTAENYLQYRLVHEEVNIRLVQRPARNESTQPMTTADEKAYIEIMRNRLEEMQMGRLVNARRRGAMRDLIDTCYTEFIQAHLSYSLWLGLTPYIIVREPDKPPVPRALPPNSFNVWFKYDKHEKLEVHIQRMLAPTRHLGTGMVAPRRVPKGTVHVIITNPLEWGTGRITSPIAMLAPHIRRFSHVASNEHAAIQRIANPSLYVQTPMAPLDAIEGRNMSMHELGQGHMPEILRASLARRVDAALRSQDPIRHISGPNNPPNAVPHGSGGHYMLEQRVVRLAEGATLATGYPQPTYIPGLFDAAQATLTRHVYTVLGLPPDMSLGQGRGATRLVFANQRNERDLDSALVRYRRMITKSLHHIYTNLYRREEDRRYLVEMMSSGLGYVLEVESAKEARERGKRGAGDAHGHVIDEPARAAKSAHDASPKARAGSADASPKARAGSADASPKASADEPATRKKTLTRAARRVEAARREELLTQFLDEQWDQLELEFVLPAAPDTFESLVELLDLSMITERQFMERIQRLTGRSAHSFAPLAEFTAAHRQRMLDQHDNNRAGAAPAADGANASAGKSLAKSKASAGSLASTARSAVGDKRKGGGDDRGAKRSRGNDG
jgi:hypothetical protein